MKKKNHVVSGFAKSNGKVVHVIISSINRNITLCEAKPMQPENDKALKDVTCKKCQRLNFYKNLVENEKENKPTIPDKKQEKKPPQEKPESKTFMQKMTEQQIQEDVIELQKQEELNTFQFIKEQYNGNIRIIHQRSGKVFFDNVSKTAIDNCLENLNKIERWNGQGTPGSIWFSEVRQAFRNGCLDSGIEYPKCLDPSNEQPKEEKPETEKKKAKPTKAKKPKNYTLPRRKTKNNLQEKKLAEKFGVKEKTTIKRRPKKEVKLKRRDKSIFREKSPKHTIIKAMEKERTKEEIFKIFLDKHRIKNEVFSIVFSTAVRQAVRNKGKKIQIVLQGKDPKGWYDSYKIIE